MQQRSTQQEINPKDPKNVVFILNSIYQPAKLNVRTSVTHVINLEEQLAKEIHTNKKIQKQESCQRVYS